jgi:hypothetical protein
MEYAPFIAQAFKKTAEEKGEEYVLCYGFNRSDIRLILSAWTWVDGSMGDTVPLTFLGADATLTTAIHALAAELDIEASVRGTYAVRSDL